MENNSYSTPKNFPNQNNPEIINQRRQTVSFSFYNDPVQIMENEIKNKLFTLSIKIGQKIELDNENQNIKKELENFQNKILSTLIIDKSSALYKKIITINKNENNKENIVIKKDIENNQLTKDNQLINENIIKNKFSKKYNKKERKYRILIRKFNIYDSMDDEEIINDSDNFGNSLSPKSFFILIYDILLTLTVLGQLIFLPIILANYKYFCFRRTSIKLFIRYFIEILYFFDIFISFFRGYYNYEFQVVLNNKKIILNYLKTDFLYDLIEAIPYFYITNIICNNKNNDNFYKYSLSPMEIIFKVLLVTKLLKIKKTKNPKQNRALELLYDSLSGNYYLENIVNVFLMSLYMFFFLHLVVCVHIFLGGVRYPNWISKLNLSKEDSFISKYISSLYFIITTMTSVGYGDIVCISLPERIFQLLLLGIGLVVYSFLITKFGNYIKEKNIQKAQLTEKITDLEEVRETYPQMSFKLYIKIRNHFRRKYLKKYPSEVNLLINSLPDNLRNKMMFTIYNKIIKNFNIFKNCENSNFILKILNCFVKMTFIKDTILINEGKMVDELFFVREGRLILEAVIDLNDPYNSLQKYMLKNFEDINKENLDNFTNFSKSVHNENNLSISKQENLNNYSIVKNRIGMILENANKYDKEYTTKINDENNNYSDEEDKFNCSENKLKLSTLFNRNMRPLKILDIRKNESFGIVYMLLEKPSPLSLIVKSNYAEVFLLRKQDAIDIFEAHRNILKKIKQKSYYNMLSIKNLTFKNIKNFCLINGYDKNFNEFLKKNSTRSFCRASFSYSRCTTKNNNIPPQKTGASIKKLNGRRYSACLFIRNNKKEPNNIRKSRNSVNYLRFPKFDLNSPKHGLNNLQSFFNIKSIRKPSTQKEIGLSKYKKFYDNEINYNKNIFNIKNRSNPKIINIGSNKISNPDKNIYNKLNFGNIVIGKIPVKNKSSKNVLPAIIKDETIINNSESQREIITCVNILETLENQSCQTLEKTIKIFKDNDNENNKEIKMITLNNIKTSYSKKIRKRIKKDTRKKNIKKLWNFMKNVYKNRGLKSKKLDNINDINDIPEEINQNNEMELNNIDENYLDRLLDKLIESTSSNSSNESDENNNNFGGNNKIENNVKHKNNNNNIYLECDNNISFNISSSYKNINGLSKGQIIKNKKFSKFIFRKLKTLIKTKIRKYKTKMTKLSNKNQIKHITNKSKNNVNKTLSNISRSNTNPLNLNVELSSINTKGKEISEEDSIFFENLTQSPLFSEKKLKINKDDINLKNNEFNLNQEIVKSNNHQEKNNNQFDKDQNHKKNGGEKPKKNKFRTKSKKNINKTFKSTKKIETTAERNNLGSVSEYKESLNDSKKIPINMSRETSQKNIALWGMKENKRSKTVMPCLVNKKNSTQGISNMNANPCKNLAINKSKCIIF